MGGGFIREESGRSITILGLDLALMHIVSDTDIGFAASTI